MPNAQVMPPEPGLPYFAMLSRRTNGLTLEPGQLRLKWARHFYEIPVAGMYGACEETIAWILGEQERDSGNVVI